MTTVENVPAGLPPAQIRPSSIRSSDVYGAYAAGVPTTISEGTAGGGRVKAATEGLDAESPITVRGLDASFLARPAGVLLVAVAALAVLSYLDR
ncbi:MAG: hypothetical protein IT352_15440 [Gemmatimonadales bacterium]|nr:hypothetical protein [Gemmatimonadales bacterium]